MSEHRTAKIFMTGRSQAVRLPKEFRFEGREVRIRRVGTGVLLEPVEPAGDLDAWFAAIDAARGGELFMPEGVEALPPLDEDASSPFDDRATPDIDDAMSVTGHSDRKTP